MILDEKLFQKAFGDTDIGNLFLLPELVKEVARLMDYLNPIRVNIARKPGQGDQWVVHRRAVPSGVAATFASTTESFTEATGPYTKVLYPYKTLGTRGKLFRRPVDVTRPIFNVLTEELEDKALDLKNKEEFALLYGGGGGGSATIVDGDVDDGTRQIKGLYRVLRDEVATRNQFISYDKLPPTAATIDQLIDTAVGGNLANKMMIVTRKMSRYINGILRANQRFVDSVEIKGGFRVIAWDGIPILKSTALVDVEIGTNATQNITALSGGTTSSIYVVDSGETWVGVLNEVQTMPLARTNSQFMEFDVFEDYALVVKDFRANAIGINAAFS